ncbi:Atf2p [Saccharomyces cerevisiae x Saccharomyces kudriavzevii VIN7]|uniref:Atf2p n=1 Tax=Saccharomyces cerevisiae x Saccharomyces kudriavzevii (strain VIN7) TaxID=1095631 RepID=H0GV96_SACCK|nr:Atf2p [Saccharomyces cerevisiae x Saccharomyces kudriavzevii VIN7]
MDDIEEYEPHVTQELINRGHARRMGHLENYFAILCRQNMYSNFTVYAELNKGVNKRHLQLALRLLLQKYPILAHTVIPKKYPGQEAYYSSEEYLNKPFPQHDFIKVISHLEVDDLIMNNQPEYKDAIDKISRQFEKDDYKVTSSLIELIAPIVIPLCDPKRPNWRLICLPSRNTSGVETWTNFVYVSNHCGSDGISGTNFFQDLALLFTAIEEKGFDYEEQITEDNVIINYDEDYNEIAKFPIPITDRIDYRPALTSMPSFFLKNFIYEHCTFKTSNKSTVTARHNLSARANASYNHLLHFSTEETEQIRAEIKKNVHDGCTITPFIQACFFVALYRYDKLFTKSFFEYGFDVALPSSSRRFLPKEEELRDTYKYGSNVGGTHYAYLISSFNIPEGDTDKFWSLVGYYHDCFLKSYDNGDHLIGLGTLQLDFIVQNKNLDELIVSSYLNKQRGGAIISNTGLVRQDTTKPYYVQDLIFSQSAGALRFAFGLNVCSTNVNGMNMDVSAVQGTLRDRGEWESFCKVFYQAIGEFASL